MPITLKCPDCGHTRPSDDGEPETCPECEGTMAPPPKKKYQAKATSLEEEARGKKTARPRDEDEDEGEPKPKKRAKARDEDDEDERPRGKKAGGEVTCDGKTAESLDLNPGFRNKALMKQVGEELSRTEVLHWAGRMCPEAVDRKVFWTRIGGVGFAAVGLLFCAVFFAVAPWFVGLIPLLFVFIGAGVAVFGPGLVRKQCERSWYAVTDQRAIVFQASPFGPSGQAVTYEPHELRRMRVSPAKSPKGAGDLIFRTEVREQRTDYVDRKTGRTVRSETSRTVTNYGFLGIEDVREVETLIQKVLLGLDDDDEDE